MLRVGKDLVKIDEKSLRYKKLMAAWQKKNFRVISPC